MTEETQQPEKQEVQQPPQMDEELAKQVGDQLQVFIDKVKETEDDNMVNMAVLNIRFENFRRAMSMAGAPDELNNEFLGIMQGALDMVGHLINMEELGVERFASVRNDIVKKGNEITKAVLDANK